MPIKKKQINFSKDTINQTYIYNFDNFLTNASLDFNANYNENIRKVIINFNKNTPNVKTVINLNDNNNLIKFDAINIYKKFPNASTIIFNFFNEVEIRNNTLELVNDEYASVYEFKNFEDNLEINFFKNIAESNTLDSNIRKRFSIIKLINTNDVNINNLKYNSINTTDLYVIDFIYCKNLYKNISLNNFDLKNGVSVITLNNVETISNKKIYKMNPSVYINNLKVSNIPFFSNTINGCRFYFLGDSIYFQNFSDNVSERNILFSNENYFTIQLNNITESCTYTGR